MDKVLGNRVAADQRLKTLASARGKVLEIGFGTGLNLAHYPEDIRTLTALDAVRMLPGLVEARIRNSGRAVETVFMDAGRTLPFEDAEFDTVVTTWTLCSIDDVDGALNEIRRVLTPGGQYLFCEHGRSPRLGKWQDRLNPIQKVIGCGCNMNRRIDELISRSGMRITDISTYIADETPELLGYMYRGSAIRE